jgi:hypothetical protein
MCNTFDYNLNKNFSLRNYKTCGRLVIIMKSTAKIHRNFRLRIDINEVLKRVSEQTGIAETRIIEDALEAYLGGGLRRNLERKLVKMPESSFNLPHMPVAA